MFAGDRLIKICLKKFECRFDFLDKATAGCGSHFREYGRQDFKKDRHRIIVALRCKQKISLQPFVLFDQIDNIFHSKFLQRMRIKIKIF